MRALPDEPRLPGARAFAALPLRGRYAFGGAQAAAGLSAWADHAGVRLDLLDLAGPGDHASAIREGASRADVVFGPYGGGAARAVAGALAGAACVVWNHGAAVFPRTGVRVVDVLAPACRYWKGLPEVLGAAAARVAVLHAASPFGRAVAAGAVRALREAGYAPLLVAAFAEDDLSALAAARERAATAVVGCGRLEDDLALGATLAGAPEAVALVACGVAEAGRALGDAVLGRLGTAQWAPDGPPAPLPLPEGAGYPAAQALAAGLLAARAVAAAGGADPDAVWDAARGMVAETFLGPFGVDAEGRQMRAVPRIVRWVPGPAGPRMRTVWPGGDGGGTWHTPAP